MKKIVLNTIIAIISILILTTCGNLKKGQNNIEIGSSMKASTFIFNERQLDSLCVADSLSLDLENWIYSTYTDYETGNRITKYMFIKHANTNQEATYIAIKQDTLYKITKRTIIE